MIEEADIGFLENKGGNIAKLQNVKVFISLLDIYNNKTIKIKKIKIQKANFNFNYESLKNFKKHLHYKIHNRIDIEKSNFFYNNKSGEVSTILPIKKINYYIDFQSREKKLNILGKLFDLNFKFKWYKNFEKPYISNSDLFFKNPNITINHILEKNINSNINNGSIKIKLLGNKTNVKYNLSKDYINFETLEKSTDSVVVNGNVNLDPFYFDVETEIKNQFLDEIFNIIFLNYYNYKDLIHKNFNGNLHINLKNIKNNNIKSGSIIFNFNDSELKIIDNNFNISKIGNLKFDDIKFEDRKGKLFFISKVKIQITNQDKFYRAFSIKKKNRIKLKNIMLEFEKDLNENFFYISNISLNNSKSEDFNDLHEFSNMQQLRKIISKRFENLN